MLRGLLMRAARPLPLRLTPATALTGWRLRLRLQPGPALAARPLGLLLLTPPPRPFSSSSAGCWRCGAAPAPRSESEPPTFFCPACRALQPADRGLDYFRLLGLPRRFRLDERRLRDSHRQLQRALHPDNFSGSCPAERRHSEEQSARANEAFGALLRPVSRGFYLLRLELPGEAEEEEEAAGERPEADPTFLGAVLEFNERLEAARSPAEVQRVVRAAEQRLRELGEQVALAFERGRPREARPLLRRMKYWSSLAERAREQLLPA